mmetsp:Transcript_12346/g.23992  ORF Transcript_12346/g.23992 Transcript_12346/m.23992 type:complete len:128 (-) Transcript_12346:966-1349(-)
MDADKVVENMAPGGAGDADGGQRGPSATETSSTDAAPSTAVAGPDGGGMAGPEVLHDCANSTGSGASSNARKKQPWVTPKGEYEDVDYLCEDGYASSDASSLMTARCYSSMKFCSGSPSLLNMSMTS